MPASEQLTIRGVDAPLRRALERTARLRGLSLNKTVLALLTEALGVSTARSDEVHDDLDELAGTWSKAEANSFDDQLRAQRQVDSKLWR